MRIKISNRFGTEPLVIGSAHLARRLSGAAIDPGTDRRVTFSGAAHVTVPVGALVLSDPVELKAPPLSDLAVSLYFPQPAKANTMHAMALQTNYIAAGSGDATGAPDLPQATTTTTWHFLTGIDVHTHGAQAVVALGDSITDGGNSTTDANLRWPDVLAQRLQQHHDLRRLGVINQGIIGNRILHPTGPDYANLFGPSALARFDQDVLAQPGVSYVIVLLGINDIGHPNSAAPASEEVSAEEIEAGLAQFIERAHEKGLKIFGATLTPFEGTTIENYFTVEREAKRQSVNLWIRNSAKFDAVIDFDAAVRDPSHPSRILPAYDSGDHLHPSDAGQNALGEAIPLRLFEN
ncbi:MAG TPA: SGNH/GDSL hydrolase family protein [Polyangiaceae bacterium]|nr:SGNH/GDSL hydrolase family protein [Polyangiaceae bacterium]